LWSFGVLASEIYGCGSGIPSYDSRCREAAGAKDVANSPSHIGERGPLALIKIFNTRVDGDKTQAVGGSHGGTGKDPIDVDDMRL
jgi:hypothetical protein